MAPKHTCLDTFWGRNEVINALVVLLNNIAPGDARKMSKATYHTLCALQKELERAVGQAEHVIPNYIGGQSPWFDDEEALLRAAAQGFMAELVKDQYDATGNWHAASSGNWLDSNNAAQTNPNSAVDAVQGGQNPPPIVGQSGLLGKVRSALGSS